MAHVVLAEQCAHEDRVDAQLASSTLEATDLGLVDHPIERTDREQCIEEKEGLAGSVSLGEGREVDLLCECTTKGFLLRRAEPRAEGPELGEADRCAVLGREREL